MQFAFCTATDGEEKGTSDSVLYLKYFIHALKLVWTTETLLCLPNFPSSSCHPLESWCGSLGGGVATQPILKITALKD